MQRRLKKINFLRTHFSWICGDVLMDILPFFNYAQLGLKLALISPRFDGLVDTHFDGKTEFTLRRAIAICKDIAEPKAKLSVYIPYNYVEFPFPDRPLPNKIHHIYFIRIDYIDHSVIEFLRSNKQIWDKGTNLYLILCSTGINVQPIWDVFVRHIWPIFTTTNVHHLTFQYSVHLDTLLRLMSPTILSDMNINSIDSFRLLPDAIGDDDGPNATISAGQMLFKWLHTPRKDGKPKQLRCRAFLYGPPPNLEWINSFKETFVRATTSVSYQMNFGLNNSALFDPFEVENERTNEKLTMEKVPWHPCNWLMKRCPIGETAAVQWEDGNIDPNLNNVRFVIDIDNNCIGPLSPPAEEAGQSNDEMFSTTPGPSDQQRNE